jgi:hypothetical protein
MPDSEKPDHSLPLAMERAFIEGISRMASGWCVAFRKVAEDTGIPYLIECEGDGKRGPRVLHYREDGTVCGSSPGLILPGEADNSPTHCFDVPKALECLGERPIIGMYFHVPQLCLVLVTQGEKIGIRSTCIRPGGRQLLTELHSRKAKVPTPS